MRPIGPQVRLAAKIGNAMNPAIAQHRSEIETLCRRFHVARLEVFGSAVRDDFDPERSDVDFLVEFETGGGFNAFDAYFDLREALMALLGRSVDLVMPGAVRNPYVRAAIETDRTLLYAA